MNEYDQRSAYENYDSNDQLSPYELLMQMQSWNKAIYLRIEDAETEMQTQLSLLDGEIRQEVTDFQEEMSTLVSTTAAGIRTEIVDLDNSLTNQILETAEGIRTTMVDADNNLSNQITTTAAGINTTIADTKEDLQTQITATANGLASKVDGKDFTGQTVASLISQSATAINLIANSLNLSGYVTFGSLGPYGNTVIDGSRIQTGYISADRLDASVILSKVIAAGGISADYIQAGTLSGVNLQSISGNTGVTISDGVIYATNYSTGSSVMINNSSGVMITRSGYSGITIGDGRILIGATYNGLYLEQNSINAAGTVNMNGTFNFSGATVQGLTVRNADNATNSTYSTYATYASYVRDSSTGALILPSEIPTTRTAGLGFGFSSASGLLYVSLNGVDRGSVQIS